jgi:hypothetical protein
MTNLWGEVLTSQEAAKLVKLSTLYLAELRRDGQFTEGIHYIRRSLRSYVWFRDTMEHWSLHRAQPEEHWDWILT